jgi:starch phosphorylase
MSEPEKFEEDQSGPGLTAPAIARSVLEKLHFDLAKFPGVATRNDDYLALSFAIRDRLLHRWVRSARTYLYGKHRTVLYLSAEYLIGPQLAANIATLAIEGETRVALEGLGLSLDELIEHEEEPGLGNGGLGRLAACYMDSLASLSIPAIGHGLRYEFGIFDQEIRDGWQVERTDRWLRRGNPWEVRRFDIEHAVGFGGSTERVADGRGGYRVVWHPERVILGVPFDTLTPGEGVVNTNFLRLWAAVAAEEFDLDAFQVGQYWRAVDTKIRSENVTKVLYPNDSSLAGKELRLEQQAFFVSCAMQDAIRMLLQVADIRDFAAKYAVQLNDTHPALAIPELMRLLVDVHALSWDEAWDIASRAFGYTNHTLMPEALEAWPLELIGRLLPRHLEIIYEINERFLNQVRRRFPGDEARVRRMSLVDEDGESRDRRQPPRQRSERVALAAAARNRAGRLRRDVSRALPQRDQRRDAATLRAPRESRAHTPAGRDARSELARRHRTAEGARAPGRGRRLPRALARGPAQEQGALRGFLRALARAALRAVVPGRRAVQAHP